MTKLPLAFAAILSTCVAVGQTLGGFSSGLPPVGGAVPSFFIHGTLVSVLQLDDGQLESLRNLNFEAEDQLFPLMRDSWEKQWELRRLSRSKSPDESKVEMILQELRALNEQMQVVGASHRERSRALLKYRQLTELGRLETALALSYAAQEALCANLIAPPGPNVMIAELGLSVALPFGFPCGGIGLQREFLGSPGAGPGVDGPLDVLTSDRSDP